MINKDEDERQQNIRYEILKYRSTDLMNDTERAHFLGLPEGCRIRENAKILNPKDFRCGKNIWIGEGAILDAQGGLEIGDFCQIGLYVMIWSHSSHKQALAGETAVSRDKIKYSGTKIGHNCFIAGHSVINAGVTIGNNVIIGPMSFVDRDLPDNSVYSNNKILREMQQRISTLEEEMKEMREILAKNQLI